MYRGTIWLKSSADYSCVCLCVCVCVCVCSAHEASSTQNCAGKKNAGHVQEARACLQERRLVGGQPRNSQVSLSLSLALSLSLSLSLSLLLSLLRARALSRSMRACLVFFNFVARRYLFICLFIYLSICYTVRCTRRLSSQGLRKSSISRTGYIYI